MSHSYLFFFLLLIFSQELFAKYLPDAEVIGKKGMLFSLQTSYFNSTGYYDSEGTLVERTEGSSFSSLDTEGTMSYGVAEPFELRLGGRFRQNTSNDGTTELSNSGFESYFAGAKYRFPRVGRLTYTLDLLYRASTLSYTKVENGTLAPKDQIEIGDIGSEVTSSLHLLFQRNDWHSISIMAGYRVPYDDLSDEIVYKAETAASGNILHARLGVEGIYSLQTSEFADNPESRPGVYYGDTYLYNGVNRNQVVPYLAFGLGGERFSLEAKASMVVAGSWTDAGQQFSIMLSYLRPGANKTLGKEKAFKEYDIEASVIKMSPRGAFVKIDQGFSQDVSQGMKFDIYKTDYFGGNILVASGIINQVGSDWSIIKLTKRFRDIAIEPGFTARGY